MHNCTPVDCFCLTDISGLCLESVITYLYTGRLTLSEKNVALLLATVTQLGIMSAVDLCQQFSSETTDDIKLGTPIHNLESSAVATNDNNTDTMVTISCNFGNFFTKHFCKQINFVYFTIGFLTG